MCSCSTSVVDHDHAGQYEEEGNDVKVYSEKFKNMRIILVSEEQKKKKDEDDEDDDEQPRRGRRRKIGMIKGCCFYS